MNENKSEMVQESEAPALSGGAGMALGNPTPTASFPRSYAADLEALFAGQTDLEALRFKYASPSHTLAPSEDFSRDSTYGLCPREKRLQPRPEEIGYT